MVGEQKPKPAEAVELPRRRVVKDWDPSRKLSHSDDNYRNAQERRNQRTHRDSQR